MTPKQFSRKKLSKVCSMEAYERLEKFCILRRPNNPRRLTADQLFYNDTSNREYLSKFLEDVCIKVGKFLGFQVVKKPDKGKRIDERKIVTNTIGQKRQIGSVKYVKDKNVLRGHPDLKLLKTLKNGLVYTGYIEIKVGKDTMSPEQLEFKANAEKIGQSYYIAKNVTDILEALNLELKKVNKYL
jgi:hypothetical protein